MQKIEEKEGKIKKLEGARKMAVPVLVPVDVASQVTAIRNASPYL
jgi:hypothetical protein